MLWAPDPITRKVGPITENTRPRFDESQRSLRRGHRHMSQTRWAETDGQKHTWTGTHNQKHTRAETNLGRNRRVSSSYGQNRWAETDIARNTQAETHMGETCFHIGRTHWQKRTWAETGGVIVIWAKTDMQKQTLAETHMGRNAQV